MSELFDPKFALKLNTMKTNKQTSKTYMAINDIYKAYDSIDQVKLKNILLAHMPMSKLNDLLIKYNNLDMQIGDKCIKRTRGIPQGAKWAPIMFNTYLDKSIKCNIEHDLIYADNYFAFNSNKEELQEHLQEINQDIEQASLRWGEQWKTVSFENHFLYTNLKELENTKNRIMPIMKDNKDANPIEETDMKLLGYNLKIDKEGTMQIDEKKALEKIKYSTPHLPPYKGINYFKQRILPKYKYIDKISPHPLFDHLYRPILQKITTILALPNKYLDANLNRSNYWSKFYSWYICMTKEKPNCPPNHNILHYDRWLHLCYLMKQYKITAFQAVNFIFNGFAYVNKIDYDIIAWKNNAKILDFLYMALMENYNAARMLSLVNFRSLKKLNEKMKFKFRKIYDPPPDDLFI